jgi:hypothetical protein
LAIGQISFESSLPLILQKHPSLHHFNRRRSCSRIFSHAPFDRRLEPKCRHYPLSFRYVGFDLFETS